MSDLLNEMALSFFLICSGANMMWQSSSSYSAADAAS